MKSRHLPHFAMAVSRLALAMSITLSGTAALAVGQDTAEHTAHHPADVSSAVKTMPAKTGPIKITKGMGTNSVVMGMMDKMDGHMKTMQELHQKFMAAKTPEERNALMPEQQKAMEEAMRMMQGMSGMSGMGMMGDMKSMPKPDKFPADMAVRHQMMEKRMEMMQSMMQMMMDRLPVWTEK